jgi:dTMP kinase
MKGVFITFEGTEGSGKSTHARRLGERLAAAGREVVALHEPGGTPTSEAIRDIVQYDKAGEGVFPETELLLFEASRAQLVRQVIQPALERGACVVCDRFADSTTAYQGYGRGFDVETVLAINAFATAGVTPDLTVLCDLPLDAALGRVRDRNRAGGGQPDRIERECMSFHERIRKGYRALADRWPDRFVTVDTGRPEADVADVIWKHVQERLEAT